MSVEPGAPTPHDPPLPSALRAPIGARLMDDLSARTDALVAAAQRTRDRTGGEAVHDLRVASRRLSEALALWRELLAPEGARRARRSLRRLRRAVGPVRELEVNLDQLQTILPGTELSVRLATEPLVRRLARRVRRGRTDAARAARGKTIAKLVAQIESAGAGLPGRVVDTPDPLAGARAQAALRAAASARALAACAGSDDDEALHAARIAIKKDRYAEECLRVVEPERPSSRVRSLRRMQQALGTVHDRAVIAHWIERAARRLSAHGRDERAASLLPLIERLRADRDAALSTFRQLAPPAPLVPFDRPDATAGASADGPPRLRVVHPHAPELES